jgi:predicted DNA binding CopG/RHH family protein
MSKATGLAAFSRKNMNTETGNTGLTVEIQQREASRVEGARERGKHEKVSLTLRLSRQDWERVHQLAVSEGVSIQTLGVEGLSKIFAEKGLPALSTN